MNWKKWRKIDWRHIDWTLWIARGVVGSVVGVLLLYVYAVAYFHWNEPIDKDRQIRVELED